MNIDRLIEGKQCVFSVECIKCFVSVDMHHAFCNHALLIVVTGKVGCYDSTGHNRFSRKSLNVIISLPQSLITLLTILNVAMTICLLIIRIVTESK